MTSHARHSPGESQGESPGQPGVRRGPLAGVRVVELAGLGPAPHGCAILADLGADVVSVVSPAQAASGGSLDGTTVDPAGRGPATNPMSRGKRSVTLDLKDPAGVDDLLRLTDVADVLVDPYRPGVCERLGIGPQVVRARNDRLVYVRLTGWGQDGPFTMVAGHDINYLAVSGALALLAPGPEAPPTIPLNLVADFAGGGMLMVVAVSSALVERARSGAGQVVDVAMVDGVASLVGPFYHAVASGAWGPQGTNVLDGGAHFYNVYATADGHWMAVGAIEPQFYAALLGVLDLPDDPPQWDTSAWPVWRQRLAERFAGATRAEWEERFGAVDACVTAVVGPADAARHPHLGARGTVVEVAGVPQPGVAPRFGRTPGAVGDACHPGEHSYDDVARHWGCR